MACLGVGFGGDSLLAYFSAPHFALLILFFPFLPVLFPLTLLEYVVWNCDCCPLTCRCELLHLVPSLFWRITVFILYFRLLAGYCVYRISQSAFAPPKLEVIRCKFYKRDSYNGIRVCSIGAICVESSPGL